MSYIDCDTIPFFWQYASRFALFDNIFATEDTPSTPNAIAMIAGQSGETQWVKHGPDGTDQQTGKTQGPPLVNDPQPFWGSQYDAAKLTRQPAGPPKESYAPNNIAANMTFASLPLTFAGRTIGGTVAQDLLPDVDLADIRQDVPFIESRHGKPVNWRWYQEGYDHEPTDPGAEATHAGYVSHHQGPQYFGYIANNPAFARNLRGMGDFFDDMAKGDLPTDGGVFYIRGGFTNHLGQRPPIQNANYPGALTAADVDAIVKAKSGDDDHPAYTDRQISESMAARVINAVADRPEIWNQSVIIINYDESDGYYDHVPPHILSYGPDGLPLARGIRVPTILISPYARAHVVSHAEGDHNAVIETIEAIFDLPPLSSLPDEKQALIAGEDARFNGPNGFVQHHLGPRDTNTPQTDDLLSAFEPRRLTGALPPLPASYARIPDAVVNTLPHYGGKGCSAIGITPEDVRQRIPAAVPPGFNTLPSTLPRFN
jgi:phospholipase C